MIALDPGAWEEGFQAGEAHKAKCPYPAGTSEAWSWRSGYVEGDAKRQRFLCTHCEISA
jgi:transposase-like protein